jgi:hypothetical protein
MRRRFFLLLFSGTYVRRGNDRRRRLSRLENYYRMLAGILLASKDLNDRLLRRVV